MSWLIGDRIENRYEIDDIKQGGFGIVYLCYDHKDKLPLALKTFQAKFLSSQKAQDEFREEALTWIRLDKHKNIVRAYYVKNIEGQPYIFLEYAAGGNLDDWLYTKQLDLPLALNFALYFCTGMDYAYQKMGLIHRDIKPSNILLTRDKTVKITDFGLAKTLEVQPKQVSVPSDLSYVQSTTAGTLPYMAPEQFTDQKIDTRADIYSFGIVLYQMVTMSYPYPKRSSWLKMHVKEAPLPIRQSIPADLADLIHKCLQKNPDDRYQNFSGLRYNLSKIYSDVTGDTIPEESAEESEAGDLINKGTALGALGRPDEAVACFDQALKINPRDVEAWNNKGVAFHALGRSDEAVAYFDEALKIKPRDVKALINKGVALGALGMLDEAVAYYDEALKIKPRDVKAWNNKGYALGALGRSDEAVAYFDEALKINPRDAEAWYNKGYALGALGRPEEAIACLDEVLKINPRDAKAWHSKGIALRNLGHSKEAILAFQKFIEFAPPQYTQNVKKSEEFIQQLKGMV